VTKAELIAAVSPFVATFGAELSDEQWSQYHLALKDVNPGDLDDAMADLRKSHAFRNAPLPAEFLDRCRVHQRERMASKPVERFDKPDPSAGEWRTHTIDGLGSIRLRVLPDDHHSLPRYACLRCKDTSWDEITERKPGIQPTYRRCGCWASNPVLQQQRTRQADHARKRTS